MIRGPLTLVTVPKRLAKTSGCVTFYFGSHPYQLRLKHLIDVVSLIQRFENRRQRVRVGGVLHHGEDARRRFPEVIVSSVQYRQHKRICCPEEVAKELGYISEEEFADLVNGYPNSDYKAYLKGLLF